MLMKEVQRTFVAEAEAYFPFMGNAPTLCDKVAPVDIALVDIMPKPTGQALVGVVFAAFMCGSAGLPNMSGSRSEKSQARCTTIFIVESRHACHQRYGPDLKPSSPNVDNFDIEVLRPGTWRIAGGNCGSNVMDRQPWERFGLGRDWLVNRR